MKSARASSADRRRCCDGKCPPVDPHSDTLNSLLDTNLFMLFGNFSILDPQEPLKAVPVSLSLTPLSCFVLFFWHVFRHSGMKTKSRGMQDSVFPHSTKVGNAHWEPQFNFVKELDVLTTELIRYTYFKHCTHSSRWRFTDNFTIFKWW